MKKTINNMKKQTLPKVVFLMLLYLKLTNKVDFSYLTVFLPIFLIIPIILFETLAERLIDKLIKYLNK